jgi:hypothetical protein
MVAAEVKPFRGREEENGQMTSWEGEALKLRLNSDGKTVRVLSGVDLPIRNLDLIWRGSMRETARGALGMLSPILKAPIEVAAGSSLFTGKDMKRQESTLVGQAIEALDPPQPIKDWLGYVKDYDPAGRPRYSFDGEKFYILFQSYAVSRLVSTTDRQFRTYRDDPVWGPVILDIFTGLRHKNLNLDEEKGRRTTERIRDLNESLVRRGVRREFTRVYEPKPK